MTLLWARAYGVIRRPRATFAAIVAAPAWISALAATTIVSFVCSAGLLMTPVGQQALVDQWERAATAFGQPIDDAAYDRMEARAARPGFRPGYAAVTTLAAGPAAVLALALLLRFALNRTSGHVRSLPEVLAVVSQAAFVLALKQIITTPLDYVRETLASPTSLVQFVSMLDETSPVARLLGSLDLLVLWWLAVLAIGLSALYGRSAGRLTIALASAYVAIALLGALTMAAAGRLA